MRGKLGIPNRTWTAFAFAAVAFAGLITGCDSGPGGGPAAGSPEAQQGAKAQEETVKKLEDTANAATKKTGATLKFGRKPGAVGN